MPLSSLFPVLQPVQYMQGQARILLCHPTANNTDIKHHHSYRAISIAWLSVADRLSLLYHRLIPSRIHNHIHIHTIQHSVVPLIILPHLLHLPGRDHMKHKSSAPYRPFHRPYSLAREMLSVSWPNLGNLMFLVINFMALLVSNWDAVILPY